MFFRPEWVIIYVLTLQRIWSVELRRKKSGKRFVTRMFYFRKSACKLLILRLPKTVKFLFSTGGFMISLRSARIRLRWFFLVESLTSGFSSSPKVPPKATVGLVFHSLWKSCGNSAA